MKLLLSTLLAALPAFCSTITFDSSLPSLFLNIEVSVNGNVISPNAGQIGVRVDSAIPALMYCADPLTALAPGPTNVTTLDESSFTNGARLAWLYNTYNPTLTQGWEAAALQLAVWEVVLDNNSDNLTAGLLQATANTNSQVTALTNSMLQASAGQISSGLTFWIPDQGPPAISQSLFNAAQSYVVATPEPANAILMGAGLLLLGALRSRARK